MPDALDTVFDILHDGCIDAIECVEPKSLRIDVDIEYLVARIPDAQQSIQVWLTDCTAFRYQPPGESAWLEDLAMIAESALGILSAEASGSLTRLFTDRGIIEITCAEYRLTVDSGRSLTVDELKQVATDYWSDWERRNKT